MGASVLNPSLSNTSPLSFLHQPHQSEPVKSTSSSFFSALAFALAAAKSVCQRVSFSSARTRPAIAQKETRTDTTPAIANLHCST